MSSRRTPVRVTAGPFWLQWRDDRKVWEIAWYDGGGHGRTRRVRRLSTGITDRGRDQTPPEAAIKILFDHNEDSNRPNVGPTDAEVSRLLGDWLIEVQRTNADPVRAAICVAHLLKFFERERSEGRLADGPRVSHITKRFCFAYQDWRFAQPGRSGKRISGATVSREMAALRAALNTAKQDGYISIAPFVPDVPLKKRSTPKDLTYTIEEIARLLNAAASCADRRHVLHFIIIMLSTHGRVEAVLDLDVDQQVKDGCINFLRPGTVQTKKRRPTVRISPTLAPWVSILKGKAIEYRTVKWVEGQPHLLWRPTASIKTAFEACLVEAGICDPVVKTIELKSGGRREVTVMKGRGGPNTLRHTIATFLHKFGIPESQIEVAAGHAPMSTNKKNYRHLRPEYLTDFCRGIERFWGEVAAYTKVHLLPHCYPTLTVEEAARNRSK